MAKMLDIEKPVSEHDPRDREDRWRKRGRKRWKYAVAAAVVLVLLFSGGILVRWSAGGESSAASLARRAWGTLTTVAAGRSPAFRSLEVEKNGETLRIGKDTALEITYRDEFVVLSVETDTFLSSGFSVDVEGAGEENDLRRLLKG
ncbi:MAG TPA: hypothetical protein PLO86_03790, partial [Syntrophales bacterium]|nr:hypothetical protein [Syntrophales bacterium]